MWTATGCVGLWYALEIAPKRNVLCDMLMRILGFRLDRRDAINLHISHRIVLSADEVLLVKHRRTVVGVGVDRAHRFEARLEHRAALAVIFDFPGMSRTRNLIKSCQQPIVFLTQTCECKANMHSSRQSAAHREQQAPRPAGGEFLSSEWTTRPSRRDNEPFHRTKSRRWHMHEAPGTCIDSPLQIPWH